MMRVWPHRPVVLHLGLILLGAAALSLGGYLHFAYISMPPFLWAALTVAALSALTVAAISRQHQQALHTLRQSERRLQQMIDTVPALIWCTTPDGTPSYINKRLMDAVGVTLEDLIAPNASRSLADIHPDDRCAVEQALERAFATGNTFAMKYRQRRSDGAYRWTEGRAEALRDESGGIAQWSGVCVDIDDMVTAQGALRNRERELSQLVDMVPSHVWRLTPEGEPAFFNKRMVDFLGLDVADMDKPGMSRLAALMEAAVHLDDAPAFRNALGRCLVTGDSFAMRYRLRRADGVYRWMSSRAEPMRDHAGRIVHWYGLCHDIDDQMHAEEVLRRSEQRLQELIDTVPVHIWCLTPEGTPSYFNKRVTDQIGLTVDDLTAPDRSLRLESVHPDDRPAVQAALARSLQTGEPFGLKYRQRRGGADYRWTEGRAEPLRDADGRIVQWYGVYLDIHDEVTAQQALRDRERFLGQLVETLPAMIVCAAPDGEPMFRSQQLREFLGYGLEEFDGSGKSRLNGTLDASIHPDDVAGVKEQYAHSLATGEPYARRHRLRRFDGEYRWVETRAAPMRSAEGDIVQWNVICLDIDGEVRAHGELRLAQEKMARASQAASLAELSASIAHEVNQPLAAVVATSHACRRWLSANPPNLERAAITLERIIRDANSASEVVSRIRALFSQMGKSRSPADIAGVVAEVCRLMADELASKDIRLQTEFDRSLPPALIDRIQIQQVLVNLIRNAIDSMDAAVDGARLIRLRAVVEGDGKIRIEVHDLGAGMQDPERAFEPFFTTKKNGMGMGLAICRSIVEAHDGRLWATSNEPRGTTLAFTLPIQARDAA